MARWIRKTCVVVAALGCVAAQAAIYTCVDAKGRKHTSDRLIPECNDREQRLMNRDGTVKTIVGPSLTATEQAEKDLKDKALAEDRQRQAEEKRVNKALVSRYPNQAAHDAERVKALEQIEDAADAAKRHIDDLQAHHKNLLAETEFYKKDPAKYPAKLKRQLEEHDQQVAAQQRFIANQDEEKRRVNARFDVELARLKTLWNPHSGGVAAAPAPAGTPVKR
jgi:hypothetical protein